MKLITTICFACLVHSFAFSQQKTVVKLGLFEWTNALPMQPSLLSGTNEVDGGGNAVPPIVSVVGQKFRIISTNIAAQTAVIQVLDYTNWDKSTKSYTAKNQFYSYNFKGTPAQYAGLAPGANPARNYGAYQRYFRVTFKDVEDNSQPATSIGAGLAIGVINFPFKFRALNNPKDFTGAFNFGAGIGLKFPHRISSKFTNSLITGYSISSVILDASNVRRNEQSLENTNNFTAFSFSIGYLLEYERVQAGLFLGSDMLNRINQNQFGWKYQGIPWVSVGFGFAIFSKEEANPKKQASNQ